MKIILEPAEIREIRDMLVGSLDFEPGDEHIVAASRLARVREIDIEVAS